MVISEVHWDGWNGLSEGADHTGPFNERNPILNDQFIELYNTTDKPINLSMWQLGIQDNDTVFGFTPGTVIQPGEYYLVLGHNTETFSERDPQRGVHAFRNGDFVLNRANDPRFPRLDFKYSRLYLDLRDPNGRVIDEAGDKGPPFWGGRVGEGADQRTYSMERIIPDSGTVPDGTKVNSWKASSGGEKENINPAFRDIIFATPGMANSE